MPSPLQWARSLPAAITLRTEEDRDREFLAELYASTRAEELRPVAWPPAQKRAFLRDQFELQWAHYRRHYPVAQWLVVLHEGAAAGRMYVEATRGEVRLMDVALVEALRNRGIGTALMRCLLDDADARGLPVTLHVEPFNPAAAWYQRLGFVTLEMRGIYQFMQRPAAGPIS